MTLLEISCIVPYDKALRKLKELSGDDIVITGWECLCHSISFGIIALLKPRQGVFADLKLIFPSPIISDVIKLLRELEAHSIRIGIIDNQEK